MSRIAAEVCGALSCEAHAERCHIAPTWSTATSVAVTVLAVLIAMAVVASALMWCAGV